MAIPRDNDPSRWPFDSPKPNPADLLDVLGSSEFRVTRGHRGTNPESPDTVDVRYSGACQLRCEYCWGPAHDRLGSIDEASLKTLFCALAEAGVRGIVHSGGETTLAPILPHALAVARDLGLRSTLSTNGIGFSKYLGLLPLIDDLGIAIDGDRADVHERMRKGADRHRGFEEALRAVLLAQRAAQDGVGPRDLTVRTVVAKRNVSTINLLPTALVAAGVDLGSLRLKLYQVEPFGPHVPRIDFEGEWAVEEGDVLRVADDMCHQHPDLNVEVQLYAGTVARYFLIGPDGEATGTDEDVRGRPIEVQYGNVLVDLPKALATYRRHGRRARARRVIHEGEKLRPTRVARADSEQ